MKTKIINLFGGPGSGKSTTAAGLFYKMKIEQKYRVELVTEYAKELAYENQLDKISQIDITIEQTKRQDRLKHKIDFIITDSPIILGAVYANGFDTSSKVFAITTFQSFDNINFFLPRIKPYQEYGRIQTEEQARVIDYKIKSILDIYKVPYYTLTETSSDKIIEVIRSTIDNLTS